jgi:hypothetical protein
MWRSAGAIRLAQHFKSTQRNRRSADKKFYAAFFERELLAHYVIWISRMR